VRLGAFRRIRDQIAARLATFLSGES
jgi:hypothetical protein